MAQNPTLFSGHAGPDAVLLADLVAAPLLARFTNEAVIDVTDSAVAFDHARFVKTESEFAKSLPFNEATLAPYALRHEEGATIVELHASTYSAYRAAREQYLEQSLDTRANTAAGGVPAVFLHTFGVNGTVETNDGQIVLVQRSALNESSVGQLSISVSENSNTGDVDGDVFDPMVTLLRGLDEELGLLPSDLADIPVFHSLVVQVPDGQVSVAAHAVTSLSAAEVLQRQLQATDAHEASALMTVSFDTATIEQLLDVHPSWVPWASPALIGALRVRFGDEVAEGVRSRVLGPDTAPVL